MTLLVKLFTEDDGRPIDKNEQVWCIMTNMNDAPRTFCEGHCFGYGEGGAKYVTKEVKRGGITCKGCIKGIKYIKAIKL